MSTLTFRGTRFLATRKDQLEETHPDPLRADTLHGPFYGTHPPRCASSADPTSPTGRTRLLNIIREREGELMSLYALANAAASINRLPIELLAEIFLHVKNHHIQVSGTNSWQYVLCVCRHWFFVGATTPRLWACIWVGGCTNLLSTSLARSKNVPVEIDFYCLTTRPTSVFMKAFPLVASHARRLQSLRLRIHYASDTPTTLSFLHNHSFPVLRTLNVFTVDTKGQLNLAPDRFPCLRELRMTCWNIFSSTAVMSQLTSLEFSDSRVTMDGLLTALLSMSNIENLILTDIKVRNTSATLPLGLPKVELKRLRNIAIITKAAVIKRLLAYISIPPASKVSLCGYAEPMLPDPETFLDLLPEDRSSLPALSKLASVRICVTQREAFIKGSISLDVHNLSQPSALSDPFELSMQFPDNNDVPIDLYNAFLVLVDTPEVQFLRVHTSPGKSMNSNWAQTLSRLRKVQVLAVNMALDSEHAIVPSMLPLDFILQVIAEPTNHMLDMVIGDQNADTPCSQIICPELRRLWLVGFWDWSDIVDERFVKYLKARRQMLGKEIVLEELTVKLHQEMWYEEFQARKAAFEKATSPFIGSIVFEASYLRLREGGPYHRM
ncbi:hypothetical protein C8Q70DRAFT_1014217 [Cubamyces menziesii]|nr:hypothetical protein C8Q70DRAFT_1014217 [Cubamyces menziesii]